MLLSYAININSYIHAQITVCMASMCGANSTSGAVLGSVSCPRTLQHADQGNRTSDLPITRHWLYPWSLLYYSPVMFFQTFWILQSVSRKWPHTCFNKRGNVTHHTVKWHIKQLQYLISFSYTVNNIYNKIELLLWQLLGTARMSCTHTML